jgi:hypothetical protein
VEDPIEIIRPDKYMKIKSKHFGYSENSTFIAEIITSIKRVLPCPFGVVSSHYAPKLSI